jgi:predicted  nucleic acid-binding Zn-ribbon protein
LLQIFALTWGIDPESMSIVFIGLLTTIAKPVGGAMTSRTAAEEHSATLLRKLRDEGKLAKPLDDETARDLLKTPPTNALRKPAGDVSPPESPSAGNRVTDLVVSGGPVVKRAGARADGVPAALAGATAAQTLEVLVEETAALQVSTQNHVRLSRDHMQRSLLQLFEDTLRDKFAGPGMEMSLRPGGNASVMGTSMMASATPSGSAGRALRASQTNRAGGLAINSSAPSLRPVDHSGQLGSVARLRGGDSMSDFVVPDAVRQQLTADLNSVLDHELQRLTSLLLTEAGRVTGCVQQLSRRMTSAEEELMQASAELDVSAQRLADTTAQVEHLNARVAELEEHCGSKDRQMDVLREQVTRRNASLDHTRTEFRREVMRYKARIYELEMEVEGVMGKARRGEALPRRVPHIGNEAVPDEMFENPERLTAAVENAERELQIKHDEATRKLRVEFDQAKRRLVTEHNARITDRDHEIIELRSKLRAFEAPAQGPAAGGKGAAHVGGSATATPAAAVLDTAR